MNIASDGFEEKFGEVGRLFKEVVGQVQNTFFEEEITPSQIQKAKELARACERKQYKDCEV